MMFFFLPAILCKNIEEEMNTLLAVGDASPPHVPPLPLDSEFDHMESPAHAIIALKVSNMVYFV